MVRDPLYLSVPNLFQNSTLLDGSKVTLQSSLLFYSYFFLPVSSLFFSYLLSNILHEIIHKGRISCSMLSAPGTARKHKPEAAKKNHAHNNKLSGRTVRP